MPGTLEELNKKLLASLERVEAQQHRLVEAHQTLAERLEMVVKGLPYLKVVAGNESAISQHETQQTEIYQAALRFGQKRDQRTPHKRAK